jgi:DNA repair ATPase RecN
MDAAELAEKITKILASSHSNVPQVFELCEEVKATSKKDEITGSYWRLMELCEKYQGKACDLACQLDSLHEDYGPLIKEEEMGAEIVSRMQRASGSAEELADELENIHGFYTDKVNARLHELDPEEYPEEEA